MKVSVPAPPTYLKWFGDVFYTIATAISDTVGASPARREALARFPRRYCATNINGVARRVGVMEAGHRDGRRIVLIHGSPGDAADWAPVLLDPGAAPLLSRHCMVAVDRPGFGPAPDNPAETSLANQAAAIAPVLKNDSELMASDGGNHGAPALLVGYSMGAPVAVQTALDFPESVCGLLILGGALDPDQEQDHALQRLAATKPVNALLPRQISRSNTELLALKDELVALAPRLSNLRIPVIIVHGTNDPLVPYQNVRYMQDRFVNCPIVDIVTIDGADHFLPWKNTDAVVAALTRLTDITTPL